MKFTTNWMNMHQKPKKNRISILQYSVRWILEQPAVVSALVGIKNKKQIDDAVDSNT
ncbi:MAG: aldo/keto reductase [Candidatus Peribacteraceae bacterium]|nr:aldo/keto reductase [Candidatus Peribacteraceae bacterium]